MSNVIPHSDSIVRTVDIAAPQSRVWAALTDHTQFGTWFRVALDQPFEVGQPSTGRMTYPGYEGYPWEARVVALEPMRRFAYEWPATGGDRRCGMDACGVHPGISGNRDASHCDRKRFRQGAGAPADERDAG